MNLCDYYKLSWCGFCCLLSLIVIKSLCFVEVVKDDTFLCVLSFFSGVLETRKIELKNNWMKRIYEELARNKFSLKSFLIRSV